VSRILEEKTELKLSLKGRAQNGEKEEMAKHKTQNVNPYSMYMCTHE